VICYRSSLEGQPYDFRTRFCSPVLGVRCALFAPIFDVRKRGRTRHLVNGYQTLRSHCVRRRERDEVFKLELKEKRRQTPAKLTLKELPETERFAQLKTEKKHFIDTIKLIAYRAESALAGETREALARDDDARALLRRLFVTPANLRPDPLSQTLTVELHRLGSPLQDLAVAHLCKLLTDSETLFPTTNLRLIFRQVGST